MLAYNGLPAGIKEEVEAAYKKIVKLGRNSDTLQVRDLLALIFICIAGFIATASNKPVKKKRIRKKS